MENIEMLAKECIKKSGISVPLIIEVEKEKKFSSFGAYHFEKKSIILRKKQLMAEYKKQLEKGTFENLDAFVEIVVFHEIGHAQDKELGLLQKRKVELLKDIEKIKTEEELDEHITKIVQVILKAEKNAWDFAEKNIKKEYMDSLKKYKKINIQNYISGFLFLREQTLKNLAS